MFKLPKVKGKLTRELIFAKYCRCVYFLNKILYSLSLKNPVACYPENEIKKVLKTKDHAQ